MKVIEHELQFSSRIMWRFSLHASKILPDFTMIHEKFAANFYTVNYMELADLWKSFESVGYLLISNFLYNQLSGFATAKSNKKTEYVYYDESVILYMKSNYDPNLNSVTSEVLGLTLSSRWKW